jgi:hypothetical protein
MDDSEGAGGSVNPRILTTTPNVKNVDQPSITSVMVSILFCPVYGHLIWQFVAGCWSAS